MRAQSLSRGLLGGGTGDQGGSPADMGAPLWRDESTQAPRSRMASAPSRFGSWMEHVRPSLRRTCRTRCATACWRADFLFGASQSSCKPFTLTSWRVGSFGDRRREDGGGGAVARLVMRRTLRLIHCNAYARTHLMFDGPPAQNPRMGEARAYAWGSIEEFRHARSSERRRGRGRRGAVARHNGSPSSNPHPSACVGRSGLRFRVGGVGPIRGVGRHRALHVPPA